MGKGVGKGRQLIKAMFTVPCFNAIAIYSARWLAILPASRQPAEASVLKWLRSQPHARAPFLKVLCLEEGAWHPVLHTINNTVPR